MPSDQYRVEMLLVEHWESVRDMILAVSVYGHAACFLDLEVRDVVKPALCDLLRLVDPQRTFDSAHGFVDAVEWLIRTKELPVLRVEVLGDDAAAAGQRRAPLLRATRTDPLVLQVVLSLPDSARGWWYTATQLAEEFQARGLGVTTHVDIAELFTRRADFLAGKGMPRRRGAGDVLYLCVPLSTPAPAHPLGAQLGRGPAAPDLCTGANLF